MDDFSRYKFSKNPRWTTLRLYLYAQERADGVQSKRIKCPTRAEQWADSLCLQCSPVSWYPEEI